MYKWRNKPKEDEWTNEPNEDEWTNEPNEDEQMSQKDEQMSQKVEQMSQKRVDERMSQKRWVNALVRTITKVSVWKEIGQMSITWDLAGRKPKGN